MVRDVSRIQRARVRAVASRALLYAAATACWQGCTFPSYRVSESRDDAGSSPVAGNAVSGSDATGGTNGEGGAGAVGGSAAGDVSLGGSHTGGMEPSGGGGVGGAPIDDTVFSGPYRLIAMHSYKCMDAQFPATAAGDTTVGQHACDVTRPQVFRFKAASGGYYRIGVEGSDECLDVDGQRTANQTVIVRTTCDGGDSQSWIPIKQDDGSYFLVNRLSGKCLDVPAVSKDDVTLQQFTCKLGGNQRWALTALTPQPLPMVVDDFFSPRMWSDSEEAPYSHVASADEAQACDGDRAPNGRGLCHILNITTFPSGKTRAGATWLYPADSWGFLPGFIVAEGATKIRFKARGVKGGEKLSMKAGGISGNAFADTYYASPVTMTLSKTWQTFELSVANQDYKSGVISAFSWRVDFAGTSAPVKFYIDDIVWE